MEHSKIVDINIIVYLQQQFREKRGGPVSSTYEVQNLRFGLVYYLCIDVEVGADPLERFSLPLPLTT